MPRFAANLSMMFTEWEFLDRFAAARDAGFGVVEFLFPYEHPADEVGARLHAAGLTQALFNLPPGDWAAGERGTACLPGREAEFRAGIATALPYAQAMGATRLHLMAGFGDRRDPATLARYRDAVMFAADTLGPHGIDVLLEPINGRDMPGFMLNDFDFAAEFIAGLGVANVKLQFDIYHRQILHGDVVTGLRRMLPITGHIQIASVPSRHEPGEELDFTYLFEEFDSLGYDGFVGCEYRPRAGTLEGLSWFAPYRVS